MSLRIGRFAKHVAAPVLLASTHAYAAPEYIQSEQTAPQSIEQAVESTEYAFRPPRPLKVFSRLRDVFREGAAEVNLRNYYFSRLRDDDPNLEAWAQGGEAAYATPWWKNRLRLGGSLYTSQKLYGPADKDGSKLLEPGQKSFNVLGQAWLEARLYRQLSMKLYRQSMQLPYLNGNDSRMVPNTFESVVLYDASGARLAYALGHTWGIKKRDATNFISMTEAAGIDGPDRAVSTAGARYTFGNGANIGAVNHYARDYMNIFYAEFNSRIRPLRTLGVQVSAQYTRQHAVGDELDGNFDTRAYGIKTATSYGGMVLSLAHTRTADNAAIRSQWGGKPGYLSLMIKDFDRAGEDAWLLGLSSDFRYFGDHGFSGFINYAWSDMPGSGRNAGPDQTELDLTLDYKPRVVEGLWLRLRGALVDREGGGGDLTDVRFIVNYDFAVL